MKNILRLDHNNRTLVMDRTFARLSSIVGSQEYNMLQDARKNYPEYQVVQREIKKNPFKESYRGLTYKYMENYIVSHDNATSNMEFYEELRLRAKCHSIRYARIKQWFIETYPEINNFSRLSENATLLLPCFEGEKVA